MAYNYRPKSVEDIEKLNLPSAKSKIIISLFEDMKSSFGESYDEFITIDIKLCKVKILTLYKSFIDIKLYKKKYPNIGLQIGDGTNPNSFAPTTKQQELCTLAIFEELLSSKTKSYKNFEEMHPTLSKIYPSFGPDKDKGWYNSFKIQFEQIKKTTKLKNDNFDVYNRDGGFMDWVTDLVNSKHEITKKDSWNPADIWLIKSSKLKDYENRLDDAVTIQEVNAILVEAFTKNEIVGISLKKNNGRNLNYITVNLKSKTKDAPVYFETFILNIPFNEKTKKFTSLTSKLRVKYKNKFYDMGVKSNQGGIGNITYEFSSSSGASAFLGKVPKDMLKIELKKDRKLMPEHTHFMKFDKDDFENKCAVIKSNQSILTINGDLENFVKNLEDSWEKNGRHKHNVVISQIFTFAYIIAEMKPKRRSQFVRDLFFMSQKDGPLFGPFGKLY